MHRLLAAGDLNIDVLTSTASVSNSIHLLPCRCYLTWKPRASTSILTYSTVAIATERRRIHSSSSRSKIYPVHLHNLSQNLTRSIRSGQCHFWRLTIPFRTMIIICSLSPRWDNYWLSSPLPHVLTHQCRFQLLFCATHGTTERRIEPVHSGNRV